MKTTINLDDANYAYLVRRSVELYCSTKKISALLNEIVRKFMKTEKKEKNGLAAIWGIGKHLPMDAQRMKDEAKDGWGD